MLRDRSGTPCRWPTRRSGQAIHAASGGCLDALLERRLALVHVLDEVSLERDVREQLVEPAGQPPGAVAEQRDDGRRDQHAHDQDVDEDRQAEPDPEHLPDDVGLGREGEEHRGHDQTGEQHDLADPRHAVDHAGPWRVALVVGLVHSREQEHVVVHAQPEQDREHHHRQERHDGHAGVGADQARPDAVLEHGHDHAVGGDDRQQVEDGRGQRDPERPERCDQQQHREPDDHPDEQRQPRGDLVREVLEPGRVAAHVGLQLGARGRVRYHLVPQLIEQVAGLGVLRRGGRDGEDRRHLAVLAQLSRGDRLHAGRVRDGVLELLQLGLVAGCALRDVDGDQERPVRAGAERAAQLVVGDALRPRRGLVAVVGQPEPHVEHREGEDEQQHDADGDRDPRAGGDPLAPALEAARRADVLGLLRLEPAPERPDHDRQDRDRGDDHRADGDRGGEAELADERHADHQQAGDRDHDDHARRDDGGARRRGGLGRRVAFGVTRRGLFSVARDDQQRVVDAGAEAEHHRDDAGERGEVERRLERREQDLAGHDADQRADERHGHRRERVEEDRQQDEGDRDADELADRERLLRGEVDEHAALLDLDAAVAVLRGLGGVDQRLAVALLEVLRLLRVADVDLGELVVLRHGRVLAVRVGDGGDVGQRLDLVQRALDRLLGLRIVDRAVLDGEDQRRVRAGERGAVRAEQVQGLLGLGARDLEVVGRLAARTGGGAEQDEHDDRGQQAALPVMGEIARQAREEG